MVVTLLFVAGWAAPGLFVRFLCIALELALTGLYAHEHLGVLETWL
jgi:hypothetical protein